MFVEMNQIYPPDNKFPTNELWVVSFFDGKVRCVLLASDTMLKSIDLPLEATYDSFDALPEWARNKIAVLNIMHDEGGGEYIARVGRRSSRDCYWLTIEEDM